MMCLSQVAENIKAKQWMKKKNNYEIIGILSPATNSNGTFN